jgi:hypothetical protein
MTEPSLPRPEGEPENRVPAVIAQARKALVDALNIKGTAAGLPPLFWVIAADEGIFIEGYPSAPANIGLMRDWAEAIDAEVITSSPEGMPLEWQLVWGGWTIELYSEVRPQD